MLSVGTVLPKIKLKDINGKEINFENLLKEKNVVIQVGCGSCPYCKMNSNEMNELSLKFKEYIFLFLYVKESHPAENWVDPKTYSERIELAKKYAKEANVTRDIVVDNMDNETFQVLGGKSNIIYVVKKGGQICYQSDWVDKMDLEKYLEEMRLNYIEKIEEREYQFFVSSSIHIRKVNFDRYIEELKSNGIKAIIEMAIKQLPKIV